MRISLLYYILLIILPFQVLSGQCLSRDSLRECISRQEQNNEAPIEEELKALLGYENRMASCPDKNDSVYTYLQMRIGMLYFLHTDYVQAIQYFSKAINIAKSSEGSRLFSREYFINSYYFLSVTYDSLKLHDQQNEAIDSTIAYEMKYNSNYHYSCFLLYNSVEELLQRGDFNRCIEHASLGESITRKWYHFNDRMEYILFFIEKRVKALWSLGRYSEAAQILDEKKDEFLKSGNKIFIAKIYRLYGCIEKSNGRYKQAIQQFLKAWQYDQDTKEKEISPDILTQIGLIYFEKLNEPQTAIQYFKRVLAINRSATPFFIYGYMANSYVKLRDFNIANKFFQKAFDKIKPGLTDYDLVHNAGDYTDINSAEHVMRIFLDKADAFLDQYQFEKNKIYLGEALRIYKLSDRLLNYIKNDQFSGESKLHWRSYASRLYNHAIESAYLNRDNENAFYFFEKSRAVLLNDQLNEQNLLSRDDLLKLAHLKSRIVIMGRQLRNTGLQPVQKEELEHSLFEYKQELTRMQGAIKKRYPAYYQGGLDTFAVSIQDVRSKILKGSGSFVSIYNGDSSFYTLLITANDINFLKSGRQSFDSARNTFNSLISNPGLLNSRFPIFVNASNELFKMIFKNIQIPAGKVIISPDGNYLPFEALVISKKEEPLRYFLNDHPVSYTYSARFLLNHFSTGSASAEKNFMGVAPVKYTANFSLSSLNESDKSLTRIANQFEDAVNLTSSAATRSNFLKQFYQYKIIQLYTHASDSSRNNEPVIYFADSALYLSDLVGENRPLTKLIVLSACETGSGKEYKGEGVFSFNRGFASLGIPSSVTNLWAVDDASTYKLTELFYKYVAKGFSLDEALQKAKLDFIHSSAKEKQLPYYWAAAVLVGNSEPLQFAREYSWQRYLGYAVLGIAFFTLFLMIIKRRKNFIPVPGKAGIAS